MFVFNLSLNSLCFAFLIISYFTERTAEYQWPVDATGDLQRIKGILDIQNKSELLPHLQHLSHP